MKREEIAMVVSIFWVYIAFSFSVVLLTGCGGRSARGPIFGEKPVVKCPLYGQLDRVAELWGMTPKYRVRPTVTTPGGIRIDPSDNPVDLDAIDELVRSVDKCMYEQFGRDGGLYIPKEVLGPAQCMSQKPKYPVDKTCFTIKVPSEGKGWFYSQRSGAQVLKWRAPDSSCSTKPGYQPGDKCWWRAGMQDGHTIITVPECTDFASWYVRVAYGCHNPWGHSRVAKCASQGRL